jgi:hypothetical protein
MSDGGKQPIGNPLADAAKSGVIGQQRAPITTRSGQSAGPASQARQQDDESQGKEPERVKRTFMLTPERARWLKIQAAIEGREMSDIVDEALETYKQLHPEQHL